VVAHSKELIAIRTSNKVLNEVLILIALQTKVFRALYARDRLSFMRRLELLTGKLSKKKHLQVRLWNYEKVWETRSCLTTGLPLTSRGGDGSPCPSWILKFDIFLLNLQQKRMFSQFRVYKKKFQIFWLPWKNPPLALPGKNPSDVHDPARVCNLFCSCWPHNILCISKENNNFIHVL